MLRQSLIGVLALLAPGAAGAQEAVLSTPAASEYHGGFDKEDEVRVTGEVLKLETTDDGPVAWVQASKVERKGFSARPGDERFGKGLTWRVEGSGLGEVKDKSKLVVGAKVAVTGYNAATKTCEPTCRISSRSIQFR